MNAKKWVLSLPVIVLILAALLAGFNYVTDPFGAFGDRFMQWFSYDETNNPRAAKISYLVRCGYEGLRKDRKLPD